MSMDLYDDVLKIRIEVKAIKNDDLETINVKFVRDRKINSNDNIYIYINLSRQELKSKILGNIYYLNGMTLTYDLLEIIKTSAYVLNHTKPISFSNEADLLYNRPITIKTLINDINEETIKFDNITTLFNEYIIYKKNILNNITISNDNTILENTIKEKDEIIEKLSFEIEEKENKIKELISEINILKISNIDTTYDKIINEIMDNFLELNKNELMIGIKRSKYLDDLNSYCRKLNVKNIDKKIVDNFMKNLCYNFKSPINPNDRSKYYKLKEAKYNKNILYSHNTILKDEDGKIVEKIDKTKQYDIVNIREIDLDITINNEDLIKEFEMCDKTDKTGFNKQNTLSNYDIILLQKSFYDLFGKPTRNNSSIIYKDLHLNLRRQYELCKTSYPKLYERITTYCYSETNDIEYVDEKNLFENICKNVKYCITNNIKFINQQIYAIINKQNKNASLFTILQFLTRNDNRTNAISNILKKHLSELIEYMQPLKDVIIKNNLHKDKNNKQCLLFMN